MQQITQQSKRKLLFTHNTAMWYRIPFFKKLSQVYDLELVFTHMDVIEDIYNTSSNNIINQLRDVNYHILDNSHGFANGLIGYIRGDYDVAVGGSWDSPQELVETIIFHVIVHLRHKPFIIWREDWDWNKTESLKDKLLHWVIGHITRSSSAIVVPGSIHKEYFQKKLGVSTNKIHIMPNVSNITGENLPKEYDGIHRILYVGRLIPRKGVIYLLEAFKRLQIDVDNVELTIIGTGSQREKLEAYVREENISNIVFTGKISNDKLKSYYQRSDITVIPSITEDMGDPWVFVLNEAMYFSNAIIATTSVGAAYDMIDGNGYLVDERDSSAIYSAMKSMVTDRVLLKNMQKKSRSIIDEKYQYKNMVEAFNDTVESVLK
ncbi:MAG: glycosyltransferase family 4 protein [Methanosphaera sp.]|nr:glycosyltransferase family 4 protein [Methanosphaera sp.]